MKPREYWLLKMSNKQFYIELDGPHETEMTLNLVEKSAYRAIEARHKKLLGALNKQIKRGYPTGSEWLIIENEVKKMERGE